MISKLLGVCLCLYNNYRMLYNNDIICVYRLEALASRLIIGMASRLMVKLVVVGL